MPQKKRRPFEIAPNVSRLYCSDCKELRTVVDVIETPDCDVAILEVCGHPRSIVIAPAADKIGLEDLGTEVGRAAFPPTVEYRTWTPTVGRQKGERIK